MVAAEVRERAVEVVIGGGAAADASGGGGGGSRWIGMVKMMRV